MNNFKKYLPSKKFISFLSIIIIFIALFWGIKSLFSLLSDKKISNEEPVQVTVGSLIQKDSNDNGIADWEEYLWGLNPDKDGPKNRDFILSKKNALANNGNFSISDDSEYITENELLSREFFATIISLQQNGELNEETIKSINESIGQQIEANPIENVYNVNMLTLVDDSQDAKENYFTDFTLLAIKYEESDIGSELTLISQGLGNNDPQALYAAKTVASAYRAFGQELMQIPTPKSLAHANVSLANNYEKTAQSIEGLSQILVDPIIGMRSIINYKNYSDAIVSDLDNISNILQ